MKDCRLKHVDRIRRELNGYWEKLVKTTKPDSTVAPPSPAEPTSSPEPPENRPAA
jgi:hypothetical protein